MHDDPRNSGHWLTTPALWEKLRPLAREQRIEPTPAEHHLWQRLRHKQIGVRVRRQHTIGQFIVDFYVPSASLVIEIDGDIHQYTAEEDAVRTAYLESNGLQVIRFTNNEVLADVENVAQQIEACIASSLPAGRGPGVGFNSHLYDIHRFQWCQFSGLAPIA